MESLRFHRKDYMKAADAVRAVADKIESDLEEFEAIANQVYQPGQAYLAASKQHKLTRQGDLAASRRLSKRTVCLAVCIMLLIVSILRMGRERLHFLILWGFEMGPLCVVKLLASTVQASTFKVDADFLEGRIRWIQFQFLHVRRSLMSSRAHVAHDRTNA